MTREQNYMPSSDLRMILIAISPSAISFPADLRGLKIRHFGTREHDREMLIYHALSMIPHVHSYSN